MRKEYTILIIILCASFSNIKLKSQERYPLTDSISYTKQHEDAPKDSTFSKGIKIVPFPVLATNPTVGWAFGFAPGINWRMGPKETTRMSSAQAAFIYTTLNQIFTYFRGNAFLKDDSWSLMADLRFQIASQPTYGLGTLRNPQNYIITDANGIDERKYLRENQMMKYHLLRTYFTAMKRHEKTQFFYGLGYHLDAIYNIDDKLLNLDTVPQKITQHYRYNTLKNFSTESNTLSGVSINLLFDSRDNVVNPYKGRYAMATFRMNPSWLGSTKNSTTLWTEYRDYFNLSKERPRHLLAWWTYGWFVTSGDVPYMNLPATGWDMFSRSGRGYTAGRFRGEDLLYSELEYRFPLQKNSDLLGGVLFVNAATASSRTESISLFDHVNVAYGLGLRIMINKQGRNNINIDYGRGLNGSNGFFIQLNETF